MAVSMAIIGGLGACEKEDPGEEVRFESISGFVISNDGAKLLATDQGLYSFDEAHGKYEFVELYHPILHQMKP